ncbi:MAG: site-2 protease family protein [bacterium]|nr:site-2 protease family protein [bacterium]
MLTIFSLIVLLFSIILHEIAHGNVANSLGDPTAKYAGRLTLNPLKHLDPFGSVILPLLLLAARSPFLIGWAKPVPINPYNFRDQKWGSLKVAVAGPAANFFIAAVFGLLIRFLPLYLTLPDILIQLFSIVAFYNILWGLFNLVPIPPLDGSHILFSFLPPSAESIRIALQNYGMFILIFFIFFGGLQGLGRATFFVFEFLTGFSLSSIV